MQNNLNIYDLSFTEITELIKSWGQPGYRAVQIWNGLYSNLWTTPEDFTNLSKSNREYLYEYASSNESGATFSHLQPIKKQISNDAETTKTLFRLRDGQQVEAVLMKYASRRTLCISTQAGCAMGCVFCATGQMGYRRNLTSGEILEQVIYYSRSLMKNGENVTNIVVMGMGEPFHNYDATMDAIERLNDPKGFGLGARRFTISTVGLIPGIRKFTKAHTQINLAISLHAAEDKLRSQLLPINKKYPLDELFTACLEYVKTTRRRLSFEWALINGINDTNEQIQLLIERLNEFRIGGSNLSHVNLIPLNPTNTYSGSRSTDQNVRQFQRALEQSGISCTVRIRRGIDIQAGCGQLANHSAE